MQILSRTSRKSLTNSGGRRCVVQVDEKARLITVFIEGYRGSNSVIRATEVALQCVL